MTVRKRLAEAASEDYELIRAALRNGIQAKKEVWVTCRSCNTRTKKDVTDQAAANRAVEIWLDQGLGRPLAEQRNQDPRYQTDVTLERQNAGPVVSGKRTRSSPATTSTNSEGWWPCGRSTSSSGTEASPNHEGRGRARGRGVLRREGTRQT
jgi:hypothetical protein